MTLRAFRVADELWLTAIAKSRREGRTVTSVLTEALKRYNSSADVSQDTPEGTD